MENGGKIEVVIGVEGATPKGVGATQTGERSALETSTRGDTTCADG